MNPFVSRQNKRIIIAIIIGFIGMPIIVGPLIAIAMPFYFSYQKRNGKSQCSTIVENNYGGKVRYIEEVYHPDAEWGFLAITDESLVFIPKKGNEYQIQLHDILNYGSRWMGTGEFTTTHSRLPGTNLGVGSTSENKTPIFYIEKLDGDVSYCHAKKNETFFDQVQSLLGQNPEPKKVNY